MQRELESEGFAIVSGLVSESTLNDLIEFFEATAPGEHGLRDILKFEPIASLIASPQIQALVTESLGGEVQAVRGIFFDKIPGANWKVPWHQDVTIAVRERCDVPGYGPWSQKASLAHVQPPAEVLQQMVALRLHLDDCRAENGPLKVISKTHLLGKLSQAEIDQIVSSPHEICEASAGDILLMKPLRLHSSSPAAVPRHRRVVHIEFAGCSLAPPLQWLT